MAALTVRCAHAHSAWRPTLQHFCEGFPPGPSGGGTAAILLQSAQQGAHASLECCRHALLQQNRSFPRH